MDVWVKRGLEASRTVGLGGLERYRGQYAELMVREERDPSDALARTRAVLTRFAAATAALVAFLASVAALNVDRATNEIQLPLWAVGVFAAVLLGATAVYVIYTYFENRLLWEGISYWRGEAGNLADIVANLEDLAYFDPITGLPNATALERELTSAPHDQRCLILLDLQDFGRVNKQHSHWKGDEYLRNFSSMISSDSRRNEYIYKDRPKDSSALAASRKGSATDAVKAFRRYEGGDEFYILLRGTIIDGLGYLNRLHGRAKAFEEMAERVLGDPHPFGFRAGMIALGKDEPFDSAAERVSRCLGRTTVAGSEALVDWGRIQGDDRTPVDFDDPRFQPGTMAGNIVAAAKRNFLIDQS